MTESLRITVMKVRNGPDSFSSAAGEIALNNRELSSRTEEQAANEQNDGIAQINIAMEQIDTTTQQNAALVEESSTAAQLMAEHATIISDRVRVFRLDATHKASEGIGVEQLRSLPV